MIKVKSKPKENANTVRKKNRWKDWSQRREFQWSVGINTPRSQHRVSKGFQEEE